MNKRESESSQSPKLYDNYLIDAEIQDTDEKYCFIFHNRNLLMVNGKIPLISDLSELKIDEKDLKNNLFIGGFYNKDAYAVELSEDFDIDRFMDSNKENPKINQEPDEMDKENPKINQEPDEMDKENPELGKNENEMEFLDLYFVFDIDEEAYLIAGRAIQIIDWENNHKFCGRCGAETVTSDVERAKVCPECGFTSFTRICPAIITTIIKEDSDEEGNKVNKVLMAKHSYHKMHNYTLIAGFLEAGETIEEAVKREVKEEVGVEVDDIEYFGSQSWPFPNSLMIGCICRYKSGDIKVDENEIIDAKWFKKEEIEKPPSDISIFSRLIKNFKENY